MVILEVLLTHSSVCKQTALLLLCSFMLFDAVVWRPMFSPQPGWSTMLYRYLSGPF